MTHLKDVLRIAGSRSFASNMSFRKGFSFVEVLIALLALACFIFPLTKLITSVRRISLGARDSVIANSLLSSCLADFRSVPFDNLGDLASASYTQVLTKYQGDQVVGPFTCKINIEIQPDPDPRVKIITLDAAFSLPGIDDSAPHRSLSLKGFMIEPPS